MDTFKWNNYLLLLVILASFSSQFLKAQRIDRQYFDFEKKAFNCVLVLSDDQPLSITDAGLEILARPAAYPTNLTKFGKIPDLDSEAKNKLDFDLIDYPKWFSKDKKIPILVLEPGIPRALEVGWTVTNNKVAIPELTSKPADWYVRSYFISELGDRLPSKYKILRYEDAFPEEMMKTENEVVEALVSEDTDIQIKGLRSLATIEVKDRPLVSVALDSFLSSNNSELVIAAIDAARRAGYTSKRERIKQLFEESPEFEIKLAAIQSMLVDNHRKTQQLIRENLKKDIEIFTLKDAAMIEIAGVLKDKTVVPHIFTRFESLIEGAEAFAFAPLLIDALIMVEDPTIKDLLPLLLDKYNRKSKNGSHLDEIKYILLLKLAASYRVPGAVSAIYEKLGKGDLVSTLAKMALLDVPQNIAYVEKFDQELRKLAKFNERYSRYAYIANLKVYAKDEKRLEKWIKFGIKKDYLKKIALYWQGKQ